MLLNPERMSWRTTVDSSKTQCNRSLVFSAMHPSTSSSYNSYDRRLCRRIATSGTSTSFAGSETTPHKRSRVSAQHSRARVHRPMLSAKLFENATRCLVSFQIFDASEILLHQRWRTKMRKSTDSTVETMTATPWSPLCVRNATTLNEKCAPCVRPCQARTHPNRSSAEDYTRAGCIISRPFEPPIDATVARARCRIIPEEDRHARGGA
jgi:hypothetical protein